MLNYINHPSLLQEWKLNLDAEEYERNIDANLYKLFEKNIIRHDSDEYWPTSINNKIHWFPFLAIM